MTAMHQEAKAAGPHIMYIRGIPFQCPGSAVYKSQSAVDVSAPQDSCVVEKQPALENCDSTPAKKSPTLTQLFGTSDLLARFGTACGSRAGISRAESEAHSRMVKSRRAVRVFAEKMVPMRVLRDLVRSVGRDGTDAASGKAQFVLVEAAPSMARVTELAAGWLREEGLLTEALGSDADAGRLVFGGAPHLAVAYGKSGSLADAGACSEAMARLEWAAAAMGLGACFAGEMVRAAAGSTAMAAALSIPTGNTAYAAVFLGYPGFSPDQTTPSKARIIWL